MFKIFDGSGDGHQMIYIYVADYADSFSSFLDDNTINFIHNMLL